MIKKKIFFFLQQIAFKSCLRPLTGEESEEDEVGGRLATHRLTAGERDETDEHHAEAGPVHPHVPLHVPAATTVNGTLSNLSSQP
jgi:hypothetical protein